MRWLLLVLILVLVTKGLQGRRGPQVPPPVPFGEMGVWADPQ